MKLNVGPRIVGLTAVIAGVGVWYAGSIGMAFTGQGDVQSGGDDRPSAVDAVEWHGLTESGRGLEQGDPVEPIEPWAPDDDTEAMGGLRGDGDIAVYDNAPCGGNGIIDLDDIFGVLDAFAGIIPCNCPAAGGWTLTGNGGTNPATDFLGTTDNVALNVRVNNLRAFRLEPDAISPNVIGGFSGNSVTAGAIGATIAGGGQAGFANAALSAFCTVGGGTNNRAIGSMSTVGGGISNTASGQFSTVGGGVGNTASGTGATVGGGDGNGAGGVRSTVGGGLFNEASGVHSTVGGGQDNTASSDFSTVGGGLRNTASGVNSIVGSGLNNTGSGTSSTVGGGDGNTASGGRSTVAGGQLNQAGGDFSFAAGRRAKARNATQSLDADGDEGTFVWADSMAADFQSTGPDQFLIRASGGVGINTNAPTSALTIDGTADSLSGLEVLSPGVATGSISITSPTGVPAVVAFANNSHRRDVRFTNGGISLLTSVNILGPGAGNGILIAETGNVGIKRAATNNDLEVEGTASKTAAGDWLVNSDRRIKKNVETIGSALETLDRVRLVSFEYTDEYRTAHPSIDGRSYMSVIAQEFAEIFPDHVKGSGETVPGSDDEILQVDPWPLTIYSAAAIQELHEILRAKDAQLAEQGARLAALEAVVRELLTQRIGQ